MFEPTAFFKTALSEDVTLFKKGGKSIINVYFNAPEQVSAVSDIDILSSDFVIIFPASINVEAGDFIERGAQRYIVNTVQAIEDGLLRQAGIQETYDQAT